MVFIVLLLIAAAVLLVLAYKELINLGPISRIMFGLKMRKENPNVTWSEANIAYYNKQTAELKAETEKIRQESEKYKTVIQNAPRNPQPEKTAAEAAGNAGTCAEEGHAFAPE